MILHTFSLLLHVAEQYKLLALYSGATIVVLSGVHAARVLSQIRSDQPKGKQA